MNILIVNEYRVIQDSQDKQHQKVKLAELGTEAEMLAEKRKKNMKLLREGKLPGQ